MLPLSANNDFKNQGAKRENPWRDINGEGFTHKAEVYGTDAIDQSIEAVIVTEPFERLFNPEFSSPFYKLLFQNESDADAIVEEVFNKIEMWCSVAIVRDEAEVDIDSARHVVSLKIPYLYNNGKSKGIFSRAISA